MSQTFWLFSTRFRILSEEHQTGSSYDLIERLFPANVETPLHLHTKYTEQIYVLEGEFTIYLDKESITLVPGDHLFIPANTPHVIAASNKPVNRALTVTFPSALAKLIRRAGIPSTGSLQPPNTSNDMGLFIEFSKESGDVILGSPGARP
jgi:quercetin dioxygenase-like cupin family protein